MAMQTVPTDFREMTPGEKTVGLDFNPSSLKEVDEIKIASAKLLDILYYHHGEAVKIANFKKIQYYDRAIEDVISAQMFAVKAATWKY